MSEVEQRLQELGKAAMAWHDAMGSEQRHATGTKPWFDAKGRTRERYNEYMWALGRAREALT